MTMPVPVSIDKSEGLFPMCAELVHAKWRQPLAEYCSLSLRYQVAPQDLAGGRAHDLAAA
jgi:hypothetical protein